jgi:hypothetical protein
MPYYLLSAENVSPLKYGNIFIGARTAGQNIAKVLSPD